MIPVGQNGRRKGEKEAMEEGEWVRVINECAYK